MNCTDFEDAVQNLLDERQGELSPALKEHLADCERCRIFWQSQQTLLSATRHWAAATAPLAASSLDAVLRELTLPPVAARPSVRIKTWSLASAAASLAAIVLLTVTMTPTEQAIDANRLTTARSSPLEAEPPEPALLAETWTQVWSGVSAEYQQMSQATSRVLDDFAVLPEPAGLLLLAPPGEPAATEPSANWLRIDRPVSERVEQAFDFLWDALPEQTARSS